MEFRLLGPLEVLDAGASVPVGGGKRRSLFALLLVHTDEVMSAERLIDELWGERPPPTVAKSLHVYVSQLRRELRHGGAGTNGDVLLTRGGGYVVRVGPDDLDIRCFEHLVAEGRRALESGDPAEATKRLRRALALWRGPPLAARLAPTDDVQGAAVALLLQRLRLTRAFVVEHADPMAWGSRPRFAARPGALAWW